MTTKLELTKGGYSGQVKGFSITEDATTIDPASKTGGVGQINAEVNANSETKYAINGNMTLTTDYGATHQAKVLTVDTSNGDATLSADSLLGRTVSDHQVPPFNGTLRNAFTTYLARVGLVPTFHASVPSTTVALPGWNGNLWDYLKDLLVAYRLEIATVGSQIVVRPVGTTTLDTRNLLSESTSITRQDAAKQIEVFWYNNTWRTNGECYPGVDDDILTMPVFSVGAGEVLTTTVAISASLQTVNQPTCVDLVAAGDYSGTVGRYSVAGNDGNLITAAQWIARGGQLRVRILPDDPHTLEITVVGMDDETAAPYAIGVNGVNNALYNSLHITGTGTFTNPESAVLDTGSTDADTGEAIGVTVENPFISTKGQALSLGLKSAQNKNLQMSWSGSRASGALGTTAGARFRQEDAVYRVDSAGFSPDGVSLSASLDTLASDFDAVWSGATNAQFNTVWAGRLAGDFDLAPLRRPA